ncbi:DMT family transporter [Cognatishimia sp. MH4019]|uniref:DMT family transporter n=1 Tax=Cognatishimia sp. MH4019 TaxID=2854030 RepID=UPI001CD73631|nr:DMT family transporter [Cognatishimia sp. MH4019]
MSTSLSDNTRGALLMTASMAGFTFNDVFMKAASDEVPLMQALFLRGVVTTLLIFAMAVALRQLRFDLPRRDWGLIALRTVSEVVAAYFFLTALFNMPIANVTAILQALPLTVTLAGALLLGEAVGWRRMAAILIGFVGVMLIVRPGPDGFNTYALYALLAVAAVTMRDVFTRKLTRDVPSLTVALVGAAAIGLLGLVGTLTQPWAPMSTLAYAQLFAAALCIIVGYLASVMVMRVGDIGFIAPFRYTGLIWALILGLIVFGEWPDWLTLLGAAIIVATGIFTYWRERQLALKIRRTSA